MKLSGSIQVSFIPGCPIFAHQAVHEFHRVQVEVKCGKEFAILTHNHNISFL